MVRKLNIRILSILVSLVLALSVPMCAYAESEDIVSAETETEAVQNGSDADVSAAEELSELIGSEDSSAILMEGEDTGDLYLVEIEEDEITGEDEDLPVEDSDEEADLPEEAADDEEVGSGEEDADDDEGIVLTEDEFSLESDDPANEDADFAVAQDADFAVAEEDIVDLDAAASNTTVYYSGYCGPSATWELTYDWDTSKYTLYIKGSGRMYDYSVTYNSYYARNISTAPWGTHYSDPSKIVVSKGITSIGSNAFYGLINASKVSLPSTLTSIGTYAFYNINGAAQVTLPSGLTSLGSYSLYSFHDVYYPGNSSKWSSIGGYNSTSYYTTVHYTKNIKNATIRLAKTKYGYTGKAIKPAVSVKYNGSSLKKGTDFKVTYKNNKKRGTATVTIKGIHNYYGSVKKTFKIVKKSISRAKVSSIKNKGYTGKAIRPAPSVKIKVGSKYVKLKKGRDYTITYKNNKKISTSRSKAQVIIKGKGNYKGTIKKTFKIVRGNPGLSFSGTKVTKTARSSFTKKAKKKVSASLTLTYKSSRPKVASVNKKTGKVTPKSVGTTKITVTSKATKHFKAGKASYTLKIRPYKYGELNYDFSNYSTSYISLSTFQIFYGSVEARSYWNAYSDMGNGGVCYGMAASSMMFNAAGSGISVKNFRSSAKHPKDLSKYDTYKSSGLDLQTTIEAMFVSQAGTQAQRIKSNNWNKIGRLVSAVKKGQPVMVEVYCNGGGHALVGYKVKGISSSEARLYVYDCNYPYDTSRYVTLYKSGGSYYGWYYPISYNDYWSSGRGGNITFTPTSSYKKLWKNRKGSSAISKMIVSSTDDFEIRNADGELVADMANGEFTSTTEDVYIAHIAGEQPDVHMVYMPRGAYSITNTSAAVSGLNVTALNVEQSISVKTDADTILMEVDDEKGVNTATFEAAKGQSYEVSLMSELSSAAGMEEVTFTGTGTGSEVTLGTDGSSCVIENAEDVALAVNGEDTAYVVFDGEAVFE